MDNDMTITSKFDEGDIVWFFEPGNVKFLEGVVVSVKYWDKWQGFNYEISHIRDGVTMQYSAIESQTFASKNDVINNIFEENGELPTPEVEENAPAE